MASMKQARSIKLISARQTSLELLTLSQGTFGIKLLVY